MRATIAAEVSAEVGEAQIIEALEEMIAAARLGKIHGLVIHVHREGGGIESHSIICEDIGHRFAMAECLEHTARTVRSDAGQKLEPLRANA